MFSISGFLVIFFFPGRSAGTIVNALCAKITLKSYCNDKCMIFFSEVSENNCNLIINKPYFFVG